MHDMLISMCTEAERLEEAVDLVKRLARSSPGAQPVGGGGGGGRSVDGGATTSGGLHEHTLNSLIRALCGKYVDRALRLLSLCQVGGGGAQASRQWRGRACQPRQGVPAPGRVCQPLQQQAQPLTS